MKVIDLLVKIVNEKEVPRHIKCLDNDYYYNNDDGVYYRAYTSSQLISDLDYFSELNDEIEIIEEPKEELEEIELLDDNSVNYNFSKIQNGMTKEDRRLLDSNFKTIGIKINKLIANQNKIIRELKANKVK